MHTLALPSSRIVFVVFGDGEKRIASPFISHSEKLETLQFAESESIEGIRTFLSRTSQAAHRELLDNKITQIK